MSSVRPNLKGFGLVNFDTSEVVVSTGFLVLSPSSRVIPQYLLHNLFSDYCIEQMSSRMGRGNYPSINSSDIKEIKLPLPPIEVQQQIVDELEGYQKIIDGCRQVVENYKPTIDIDPSWEMVELGEIVDLLNGYAFKSSEYVEHSSVMNFRMSQIRPGGFVDLEHNPKFLPENYASEYSNFLLREGDVVIAMTDMASDPKILGVPTIIKKSEHTLLLNQRVGKLFGLDKTRASYDYIGWILKSDFVREFYKNLGTGGVQINIGKNQILSIKIPLPSLDIQDSIVVNCREIESLVDANKRLIEIYTQKIQDRISRVWGEGVVPIRPSIDEIMEQIESGVLVYPQNDRWHDFFKFLKSKIPNDIDVPNPLILGGSGANDFSKNQRLKEQLTVAEQNGLLADAIELLSKIPESQWVKSDGNLHPNELDYWQLDELHRKELKDNVD